MKDIKTFLTEENWKAYQGEHDKSKIYDDLFDDVKDNLKKWKAGPVYGYRGDHGIAFQIGVGEIAKKWVVIEYEKAPFNDSLNMWVSTYGDDNYSNKYYEPNVYSNDIVPIINDWING